MLLIFPWERWKFCCSSQIYLRGPISKSLKWLHRFAKLIKIRLLPVWGPFNPYVKLSAYFGWHQQSLGPPWQQDGVHSSNGKARKGLAWTAAPHEWERESCHLSCCKEILLQFRGEPFARKPRAWLAYYLLLLPHAMESCNSPFDISLQENVKERPL